MLWLGTALDNESGWVRLDHHTSGCGERDDSVWLSLCGGMVVFFRLRLY